MITIQAIMHMQKMQFWFVAVLLVVVISLNISTTTAQCTKRDVIVGTGYNLIYGNPQAKMDPGLRRTHQILRVTYNKNLRKKIRSLDICVPDQGTIVPLSLCSYIEESKFFAGTASYRNELEKNVKVGGEADYGLVSFAFSLSDDYKKIEKSTSSRREVYLDKEVYCFISNQRYRTANVPYDTNYGVSYEFHNAFLSLPKEFSNGRLYYQFLYDWGTHIVVKATLGGRHLQRTVSTLQKLYAFAEKTDTASITSSGNYEGYSASLDLDLKTLNNQLSSNTTFGEKKVEWNIGSTLTKTKNGWKIPEGDDNIPEPAKFEVISVAEVCSNDGYWNAIRNTTVKLSVTAEPLKTICLNLVKALKTFPQYKKLNNTPDNLRIPLIWPDGTYGFPKPKNGCPDQKNLRFDIGYRKFDTVDKHADNKWSPDLHLSGWYLKNDLKTDFCMKTIFKNQKVFNKLHWPNGNYCFYKLGTCPPNFKVGWINWTGERKHNMNGKGGVIPDGEYGTNTKINFCCRKDAYSYTVPMLVPNHHPFYLLRIGGYCQYVKGMMVSEEFVEWSDEKHHNKDGSGGLAPDAVRSGHKPKKQKLFFCYYHKH